MEENKHTNDFLNKMLELKMLKSIFEQGENQTIKDLDKRVTALENRNKIFDDYIEELAGTPNKEKGAGEYIADTISKVAKETQPILHQLMEKRIQELMVEKGLSYEEAHKKIMKSTLLGEKKEE